MSDQWEVKSVSKSGDNVHVVLGPVATVGGLFSALLGSGIIGCIFYFVWGIYVTGPAEDRNRIWTAAPGQILECGNKSDAITAWYSDSGWTITHNHDTPTDRVHNGRFQYYPVVVETNDLGAIAVTPNGAVGFAYVAQDRIVVSPQLGQWGNCRVRLND